MPILGVTASSISGHLIAPDTGAMVELGMVQVGSAGAASITFSSIPSTYKHLQVRCNAIWTYPGTDRTNIAIFNNSSSDFTYHTLLGGGSTASSGGGIGLDRAYIQTFIPSGRANTFGVSIIDILDYASTSKNKTIRGIGGYDANGTGELSFASSLSIGASAINSLTISPDANTWGQFSSFALYGIKG